MTPLAHPLAHRVAVVAGVVLVGLAVATSLVLGTLGWFAVGLGVMTDCTTDYSCSAAGCSPCAATSRWITVGGVAQLGLALSGVVVLVPVLRTGRGRAALPAVGVALLAASVGTIVATTSAAEASYCRPGTPGYAESYCSTDD